VQLVEIKANTLGFSFGEYIRYILANDVKSITETVEIMDKETEKDFAEALIDVKNNNLTKVSKKEIARHLEKIIASVK
jgi:alpha/beta superfamily hydrolase